MITPYELKLKNPVRILGLTGSIGTGKTTATAFFRELGIPVVCADEVARKVVELGSRALAEIRDVFGGAMIDERGELDRERMGALIFNDPEARDKLNSIVHPRVGEEAERRIRDGLESSESGFVVYDVPLLYENHLEDKCDLVAVVYAPEPIQIKRLIARNGYSLSEAVARVSSQISIEEKAARCDVVLDNSTTVKRLGEKVRELVGKIKVANGC